MSSDEEMLDLWKRIAGDTSPRPWTEDNLAGFLQRFRPDGTGVAAAFEGMVGGDEIVPRLMEVYRATETAWDAEDGCDGYFIVRDPAPMSSDHATDLLRLHLGNLAAMSEAVGCDELTALLRSSLVLQAVEGETPWPPGDDDPETLIYDVTCQFMESLTPRESAALLMGEAFWTIACDYNLQHHILWPLYRDATAIEEPFRPYFVSFR